MSILIKNPMLCCRMSEDVGSDDVLNTFRSGHIYIEDNKIISAGPEEFSGSADEIIDASRMLILPGLVNTHHHFFQTLTRNIYATKKSELFDWLITNYEIWRGISSEAFYISAKTAITELLKSGCTTTSDQLYLFPQKTELTLIDREIEAAREMGIRFQPTRGSMSLGKKDGGLPPDDVIQTENQIIDDTLRLVQQYHDNSFGAMTRISLAPCSPFSITPELMKETARIAREHHLQIHTHLAETQDEEVFCLEKLGMRPFDFMESVDWIDNNAWFAHCIYLNDDEIWRGSESGIAVAHCPSSNMRLGSGIARIKKMLDTGINVSIGVDGSASNDASNMLLEMRNAMLISRLRDPQDWLSTEEILWMATVGGAQALGRDDIGRIDTGKCADITMISMDRIEYAGAQHDPAAAVIFCVAMNPVDWVIVNGQVLVEKGTVRGLDEPGLIHKHQQISDDLLIRAGSATGTRLRL